MKALKSIVGWPAAWLLYYLGDLVSKPLNAWDWAAFLYPAYNRLMLASSSVQDWSGCKGPWRPATMDTVYDDGSDHKCCHVCGYCKDCGDCDRYGCGW
jgi:hypothetical protein